MVSFVNLDCLDFFLQAGALALSADESGGAHMTRLFRVVQLLRKRGTSRTKSMDTCVLETSRETEGNRWK
jgi:hypothetical protein